jgi:hypothetical protein
LIHISQGFHGIGIKIPKRMVKVKKEMTIIHNAKYEVRV